MPLCTPAEDTESSQAHLGGVIVRDLSCVVSNYRSKQTLDEYCKEQVSAVVHLRKNKSNVL